MIAFDYHSHHWRCGHATGEMSDYVEVAIGSGMTAFGVSDHGPAYWTDGIDHPYPQTQMASSELPAYVADARRVQADFSDRIDVRVGLEADFLPDRVETLTELLTTHSFDYVLGSVHYALGRSVFDRARWREQDPEAVWRDYYGRVIAAAQSELFDILSHLTVVEAYSPPLPESIASELYSTVADTIAQAGCAVEINTSGYRKMGGDEPFPNRRMLRELIRCHVPLTFGSDSHCSYEVGFGRERVEALLGELGVSTEKPQRITVHRTPIWVYPT